MTRIAVLLLVLAAPCLQALSVYQVDAVMRFDGKVVMDATFVILEQDTSRFEEHGKGGYSLVLSVRNASDGYIADSSIYADLGKGPVLLAEPSLSFDKEKIAHTTFEHEQLGSVSLQLTLVKHHEMSEEGIDRCDYVECD